MVMATQIVDLTGVADMLRALPGDVGRRVTFDRSWKAIGVLLPSEVKRFFAESRAPDGTRWKPLKDPGKKRGGKSAKPLRNTGLLMASLTSTAAGRGAVREVTRTSITVGSALSYASYHMTGTRRMPSRPFMWRTGDELNRLVGPKIEAIIADDVARQVAGLLGAA